MKSSVTLCRDLSGHCLCVCLSLGITKKFLRCRLPASPQLREKWFAEFLWPIWSLASLLVLP